MQYKWVSMKAAPYKVDGLCSKVGGRREELAKRGFHIAIIYTL